MSRQVNVNTWDLKISTFNQEKIKSKGMFYFRSSVYEPPHDKTNKMACAPSEESDQPGHPSSLIRVFAVRSIDS